MKLKYILAAISFLTLASLVGNAVAQSSGGTYNAAFDTNNNGVIEDGEIASAIQTVSAARGGVRATVVPSATPVPSATAEPTLPAADTDTPTPTSSATPSATPTASNTPTPSATSTPTRTPVPTAVVDVAGQPCQFVDDMHWHAATGPNGCVYGHEHGDAPPAWISGTLPMPMYMHSMNSSPIENVAKHSCMKGFLLGGNPTIGQGGLTANEINTGVGTPGRSGYEGWQAYAIYHACANPPDRLSQYHSIQWWIKDPTGAVSYGNHWVDTGDPRYYLDGGTRVETAQFDKPPNNGRPILRVDWGTATICEQWYQFGTQAADWLPDTGLTICNTPTAYNATERAMANGTYTGTLTAYDTSWWTPTGGRGGMRNYELVQYAYRIKAKAALGHPFWHDQFGQDVAGANDPTCGQPFTFRGKTFTKLCDQAYIAPSLYTEMLKVTTFSAGQYAPRETHTYNTTGVGIKN